MKITSVFTAAVLLAASCAVFAQDTDSKGRRIVKFSPPGRAENEFAVKLKYIKELVMSYVDAKADISEPSIVMEIHMEIGKNKDHITLDPKVPADTRTDAMISSEVDKVIRQKYKLTTAEYRKKIEKQAEQKFRLYQFGEKITLHYQVGSSVRTVTGKFGQFNGRDVTVGFRHVPFCDLLEEDKAHVSKEYAAAAKEKYVRKHVDAYVERRNSDRFSRISKIKKRIMEQNKKNGYLYLDRKWWLSPRQYADQIIKEQIKQHPELVRNRASSADAVVISTDTVNNVLLKQKISKIKLHLAGQSKIDQDSGCLDAVFWGFTREEVKASLSDQGINMISTRRGDDVDTNDRQIENISLMYENNKLVKLEEVYPISDVASFSSLKLNMVQKYGNPDNVKDIRLVPALNSVTWTGKYTRGTLLLERDNADKITAAKFRRQPLNTTQPFGKDIQF